MMAFGTHIIYYRVSSIEHQAMRTGAIILCGGKSSRMGRDKATLPFGPELMLQRVVRLVGEEIRLENVVVVAAPQQVLPALPKEVLIARDAKEYRGPLAGLATGLGVIAERADAAFATACDVPLLVPAFVRQMFELLGGFDIAVPFDGQYHYPLAAVYRPAVRACAESLLDAQLMRPRFLFDEVRTREVPVDDLRAADPNLSTLENLNYEVDYFSALSTAGYSGPPDMSQ
jgi:molybdopterin-guanine dinucleotide biosynthesis protein A